MKYGDTDWLNAQYRRSAVDPWGLNWRPTQHYRHILMLDLLRQHLSSRDSPIRIMDIGCATGDFTSRLASLDAPKTASVLGIDIAEEAVARAKIRHPHVDFECADLRHAATTRSRTADCVTCLEVLYYLPKEERLSAVQQLAALLRPNGILLVSSMISRPPYLTLGELLSLVEPLFSVIHTTKLHLRPIGAIEKLIMRARGISWPLRTDERQRRYRETDTNRWFEPMRRVDSACAKIFGNHAASHGIVIARRRPES